MRGVFVSPSRKTEENRDEQEYPPEVARGWHARTFHMEGGGRRDPEFAVAAPPEPCHFVPQTIESHLGDPRNHAVFGGSRDRVARSGTTVHQRPFESMGGHHEQHQTRELGEPAQAPSGRWQARYPGPDGTTYTARTDQDRPLTFLTKTDARTWLAGVQSKMARGLWEPPEEIAARLEAELATEQAQSLGFEEYSKRWLEMIRTEPNRSGKKRAVGTVRSYQGKVTGYLVPEFRSTPVREIDAARIKVMTDRLDQIPAPLNPNSKFNGITRSGAHRAHDDPPAGRPRRHHPSRTECVGTAARVGEARRRPRRG